MSSAEVWDSSRPRHGRRFEPTHEVALHEVAAQLTLELRGASRGIVRMRELAGPIGIPDLTVLVGDPGRLESRLALDVPPILNEVDAGILSGTFSTSPRSALTVARSLGWPVDTILRRVPGLVRQGALRRVGETTFIRPAALGPVGRVIAVEAKVKDWRGALAQARTYAVWADNYLIVMGPLTSVTASRVRDEVERDSGGLIIDGAWVLRPKRRQVARSKRVWASEHFVAGLTGVVHQPSEAP